MGGFVLYEGDNYIGAISPRHFRKLVAAKAIDFPCIKEKEINDRSKGDELSKGLAIIQTAWFIVQYVAGAKQHSRVVPLESATLAYAALNALLYFFWWNKPLNPQIPVPIRLRRSTCTAGEQSPAGILSIISTDDNLSIRTGPQSPSASELDQSTGPYAEINCGNAFLTTLSYRKFNAEGL